MPRKIRWLGLSFSLLFLFVIEGEAGGFSQIQAPPPPEISGGGAMSGFVQPAPLPLLPPSVEIPGPLDPAVAAGFLGFGFDDNAVQTGSYFIPPDPIGTAGTDRLIAVVNTMIEARSKSGTLLWRDSLKDFFASASGNLGTNTFDPKVIWDHYKNCFLVVALEKTDTAQGGAVNASRILLAVSKTATPATATSTDWYYHTIDSKINISGIDRWADYPGFAVDEEAVYITSNMFAFAANGGAFGGVRLWIVNKGVSGGFYGGSTVSVTVNNPYASAGTATTTMPAQVFGAGGVGSNIGTFLVSYSALSDGTNEYVQVVRVDNPLSVLPLFTQQYIPVGNIDAAIALPNAPQLGTANLINTNDQRAQNAVWRDNALWITATGLPPSGSDTGQVTAHWFKLNAVGANTITLADQGNIGGEDVAPSTYTFFPSVAVNAAGDAMFGFAGSAETIYAGAYAAGRQADDTAGTVQPTVTVKAGVDYYYRAFGGTRNRWGDYSGIAVDPTDYRFFWVFNEYADTRGTVLSGEDGRWGTAWAKVFFNCEKTLTLIENQWHMIALPCEVTTPNNTVEKVFDELSPATYGTEWRVYRRDAANDQYIQLSLTDTLQAGLGYWIKTKASGGDAITVGSSTSPGNPQADVPLDSSSTGRYNLVGHPFVFDVCWKDVQVVDGANVLSLDEADPLVGGNRACSLSTPDSSCVMSHTMGQWNGAAYQSYDGGTPGLEGVLSSFEGLWVQAFKSGIQLRIPVKRGAGDPCATVTGNSPVSAQATTLQETEQSASEPLAATATEQKAASQANKLRYSTPSTRHPEEWGLRLIVEADGLVDPGNLLGRLWDSVAGPDQHDLKEPSPFDGNRFLTIVFPHPEWDAYAGNYTSDYRAVANGGVGEWSFEVHSDQPRTITLSWSGPQDILQHSKLLDDETKKIFNPRANNTYKVTMIKPVHRFRWRVNGGR